MTSKVPSLEKYWSLMKLRKHGSWDLGVTFEDSYRDNVLELNKT